MPINLADMATGATAPLLTPKFFDKKLTGRGQTVGAINEAANPKHINKSTLTRRDMLNVAHKHYTNGSTEVTTVPFDLLSDYAWSDMVHTTLLPDDAVLLGTTTDIHTSSPEPFDVYVRIVPQSALLEHTSSTKNAKPNAKAAKPNALSVMYRSELYYMRKGAPVATISHSTNSTFGDKSYYKVIISNNPRSKIKDSIAASTDRRKSPTALAIDEAKIDAYIDNYELYDGIVEQAKNWSQRADLIIGDFLEDIHKHIKFDEDSAGKIQAKQTVSRTNFCINEVAHILRRLETYNIPLDTYRSIYNHIQKHFSTEAATVLCKMNLRLLLSDTLAALNQTKPTMARVPKATPTPKIDPRYSSEQCLAIKTDEPLVVVQAGAGTGKSTVILARIDYMLQAGVAPEDITVLSFTNAAADHIHDESPCVHSMTIAKMIHTIYSANFTQHELSSIETILNSISIYYDHDQTAESLKHYLKNIVNNEPDAFTLLNNYVEQHYDEVIAICDRIHQTSLELEIIVCYQKIDTFTEPAEVQSKHLIIDEVQDNSVFEFIYALRYVNKHAESLFLVGDASQTLYEFRAANPQALNMLEGSGVFAMYQLQTNYRSNQEILDFANIALNDIQANQYAQIQLHADSLQPVTADSFVKKVRLVHTPIQRMQALSDALRHEMATDVKAYIDEKLAAGEQVAFLAFTKRHVREMQSALELFYSDKKIVSLVPKQAFNSTIISAFIRDYWNEVQFVPTTNIVNLIIAAILDRFDCLVPKSYAATAYAYRQTEEMLKTWSDESSARIKAEQSAYVSGFISLDEFINEVQQDLLAFEIRRNAVRQSVISQKNAQEKKNRDAAHADLVVSTIHSAKGLEFDNVVVLYKENGPLSEENKRMYYVALTRAMHSEFIVSISTTPIPKIQTDYKAIVTNLTKPATATGANAQNA